MSKKITSTKTRPTPEPACGSAEATLIRLYLFVCVYCCLLCCVCCVFHGFVVALIITINC